MTWKKRISQSVFISLNILFGYVSSAQVTFFSDRNYQGTSRVFTEPGEFRVTFDVKSISITPGYLVILPESPSEGGFCAGRCKYWRSVSGSEVVAFQSCGVKIVRITDTRDARLLVIVGTGGDDLRKGSKAFLNITTHPGGTRSLPLTGSENGIAGNEGRTFRVPVPDVRLDQILAMSLSYESGSSGMPFETTDNWNVNSLTVEYQSGSDSDGRVILFQKNADPIVRFTGNRSRYSFRLMTTDCSNSIIAE